MGIKHKYYFGEHSEWQQMLIMVQKLLSTAKASAQISYTLPTIFFLKYVT